MKATLGELTANDIGSTEVIVRHEGSTVTGLLTALQIETELIRDDVLCGKTRSMILSVDISVTIGSIKLGPLKRDHACEVLS